jgi:hypothetical protein
LTLLLKINSVEDSRAPPIEGLVRAELLEAYYYLQEVQPNKKTKIIVQMAVDPKGAIPLWLVRASQKNWPQNTMAKLRDLASDESIPVSQKILDYFNLDSSNKRRKTK